MTFIKGHPKPEKAYSFPKGNQINKGKHNSPETEFKKGLIPWSKGKKCPQISEGRIGNKNPNWKGGITPLRNQIYKSIQYKQWRSNVFMRDDWTCQTCGTKSSGNFQPHHTPKSFSEILEKNKIKTLKQALRCKELWDINNGITLCKDCHKLTYNYFNHKQKDVG